MKNKTKKILIILIVLSLFVNILVFAEEENLLKTNTGPSSDIKKSITDKEEDIAKEFRLNTEIQVKNADIEKKKGELTTTINIKEGTGSVKVKTKDGIREYSDLQKLKVKIGDGATEKELDPKIVIDNDGKVIEAKFTVGKDGKYAFANREYELTKGTKIYFEKGQLYISPPDNGKVITPKKIGTDADTTEVTYQTQGSGFQLENGDKWTKGELKFKEDSFYFQGKDEIKFGGMTIRNPNGVKTYLDFKGEVSKVNGPYLSVNSKEQKIVIGTNSNDNSPTVRFDSNLYGLQLRQTDHISAQVLGGNKEGSYFILNGKDRFTKDLASEAKTQGWFAVNEDNKAIGTYLKDGKLYFRTDGKFSTEFNDDNKPTTVPLEVSEMLVSDGKGGNIPVSGSKFMQNGKEVIVPNKMVVSANLEVGLGTDPYFIRGAGYANAHDNLKSSGIIPATSTALTRGVSNRLSYNYIQYTEQGFEKYTGIPLSMDNSVRSQMTADKYRELVDMISSLPAEARKDIHRITIYDSAGFAGRSSSGSQEMELTLSHFNPGTFRHEAIHLHHFKLGDNFDSEWNQVEGKYTPGNYEYSRWGGPKYGFAWGYGSEDNMEDKSTFGDLIYNPESLTPLLQESNQWNKIYRGKLALLNKYQFITDAEFNTAFNMAGLPGVEARDKYIADAKSSRS